MEHNYIPSATAMQHYPIHHRSPPQYDPYEVYHSLEREEEKYARLSREMADERRDLAMQLGKTTLATSGVTDSTSNNSYSVHSSEEAPYPSTSPNVHMPAYSNGRAQENLESADECDNQWLLNRKVDTHVDKKVYRTERVQRRIIPEEEFMANLKQSGDTAAETVGGSLGEPVHETRFTTRHVNYNDPAGENKNDSSEAPAAGVGETKHETDEAELDEEGRLISRNTSSVTQQEVTTVTRVYRTYERVPNDFDLATGAAVKRETSVTPSSVETHDRSASMANQSPQHRSPVKETVFNSSLSPKSSPYSRMANERSFAGPLLPSNGNISALANLYPERRAQSKASSGSTGSPAPQFRDPDLCEVIQFLCHPNNVVRSTAAAHLAHISYRNDHVKALALQQGAIPLLIDLLQVNISEVQHNACAALRNLSFGQYNDENKRALRNAGGIPALLRLFQNTRSTEIKEAVTATLWNLSSCDELKMHILDESTVLIVNAVLKAAALETMHRRGKLYNSTIFMNCCGILRNVSSAGYEARRKLRECDGLLEALVVTLKIAVADQDIDGKPIENVVCVLRNLSYRCQEMEEKFYDRAPTGSALYDTVDGIGKDDPDIKCFTSAEKPNKKANKKSKIKTRSRSAHANGHDSRDSAKNIKYHYPKAMDLLWCLENVKNYLNILQSSANPDTLEAAAGVIQNLSACSWKPSEEVKALVRREKGLPIMVECLRMPNDMVVCSIARALRNLAIDGKNRDLIGKYAMPDLVNKLPNAQEPVTLQTPSEDTVAAVLAIICECVRKNSDFAKIFLDRGGIKKLVNITHNDERYGVKVVRFSVQLLKTLWSHSSLHDNYKHAGFKESHFMHKPPSLGNRTLGPSSTIQRPFSSQGETRYEDRTIRQKMVERQMREQNLYSQAGNYSMPNQAIYQTAESIQGQYDPVYEGVNTSQRLRSEMPVYAQVNLEEKHSRRQYQEQPQSAQPEMIELYERTQMAGDSWV